MEVGYTRDTLGRTIVHWSDVLFEVYLAHGSNVPTLYGALAGFIVLMLWIYLANLILLIGAETDTVWRELKVSGTSA